MRSLYTLLLYLLTPLVLLRLLWRGFELRDYWYRWGERFGFVAAAREPVAVWVHAVSVGESLAAMPLIHALIDRHGERRVLVTTTTPTGSARVRAQLGERVLHSYAPYDLPGVVARFLDRMQPRQVVVMETELWPNLFHALARRGLPLFVVNARLSPNSFRGYSKLRRLAAVTLSDCSEIAAQSEADAARFRSLGAPRVSVMGNIKFDMVVPEAQLQLGLRHHHVELDVAHHAHARRAKAAEARCIGLALRGDLAAVRQGHGGEAAQLRIAAEGVRRQPRVDHEQRQPTPRQRMEQVGPQFGFHHHDLPRLHPVEEARHHARQVVGRIAVQHALAELRAHASRACRRSGGDQHAALAVPVDQRMDQRHRGQRLADRHRMHPDRDRLARGGDEAEALAPAIPVVAQFEAAPEQAQQDQRCEQVEQQGVERSHAAEA